MAVRLELASGESQRAALVVADADRVLAGSFLIQRGVVDVETAVRAFAATGDRLLLAPAVQARAVLPVELADMERWLSQSPLQQRRIVDLRRPIDAYLNDYALPLSAGLDGLSGPGLTGSFVRGKRLLDALRVRFAQFNTAEQALRTARAQAATGTAATFRWSG